MDVVGGSRSCSVRLTKRRRRLLVSVVRHSGPCCWGSYCLVVSVEEDGSCDGGLGGDDGVSRLLVSTSLVDDGGVTGMESEKPLFSPMS